MPCILLKLENLSMRFKIEFTLIVVLQAKVFVCSSISYWLSLIFKQSQLSDDFKN